MANASQANPSAKLAKKGILIAGIVLVVLMIFGGSRNIVATQFLNASAGSTVETQLIDVANKSSPTIDVLTQLQYTQSAVYKAEVVSEKGDVITQASHSATSRSSSSRRRVGISSWPNPNKIKVRLSVASQNITATPPTGITAAQVPVIFEINVYSQRLNNSYLWPALIACIALWTLVTLAEKKAAKAT